MTTIILLIFALGGSLVFKLAEPSTTWLVCFALSCASIALLGAAYLFAALYL